MELAQTLALALSGVIAVPVLQLLKKAWKIEGTLMAWFSFLFAVVLSVVALATFGQLPLVQILGDPALLFTSGGVVMAVSQVVYASIKSKL
jgi:hypothetical protein